MNDVPISFLAPASRAWQRMAGILFRPFDLRTWLVLGFTAWLAGLGSHGGGGGANASVRGEGSAGDVEQSATEAWNQLATHPFWFALAILGCFVLLLVIVVVLWLSSRGKFMFLDNVVHRRARVVDPWKRFRRHGNSLFFFTLAAFAVVAFLFGGAALTIAGTVGFGVLTDLDSPARLVPFVLAATVFAVLALFMAFAVFCLEAFVVPLMHRYDLGAIEAWRRFLALFGQSPGPFLACGLLVLVAGAGVVVAIVYFGLLTCCLGFLLLMVPYVGSVVMLPVSVLYRGFTLEFLAQFDPELLPSAATESIPAAV